MNREAAIQQLDDEMMRKYVLGNDTLHVFGNPFPEEKDTHRALAVSRNLDPNQVKGGYLKVEAGKLKHAISSTTVPSGSQSDLDGFTGEVEIF